MKKIWYLVVIPEHRVRDVQCDFAAEKTVDEWDSDDEQWQDASGDLIIGNVVADTYHEAYEKAQKRYELSEGVFNLIACYKAEDKKRDRNAVYRKFDSSSQMSAAEISSFANEHGMRASSSDYIGKESRLSGTLCQCGENNGEFVLEPVEEGQKLYIKCRICGGVSHL